MSHSGPDYFQLLGVPETFDVDAGVLAQHYRERQQWVHPDRYAGGSPGERLRAVQLSSQLNEAYHCLRQPLSRALYLLARAGHDVTGDHTFRQDPGFLMQQMQWRESLAGLDEEADPRAVINHLHAECANETRRVEQVFRVAWTGQDWESARSAASQWQFLDKFHAELDAAEERWQDA